MTRFEYKEPEFKVIITTKEDILTTSGGAPAGLNSLDGNWDTGDGIGGVSFGV